MNRDNLKGAATGAVKGVKTKTRRAKLYCEALELDGVEEILAEIDLLAEQVLERIEEADGEEE